MLTNWEKERKKYIEVVKEGLLFFVKIAFGNCTALQSDPLREKRVIL